MAKPGKIVFLCVHNSGRSQMAAAFFNLLADTTKARATSAGTDPAAYVQPEVIAAMKEEGIDLSAARPRLLIDETTHRANVVVTMGCGDQCPVVHGAQMEDWNIEDPAGKSQETVRRIRDEIRDRVRALIEANHWQRQSRAARAPR